MVSDKAMVHYFIEINSHKETESSETSKYLLGGKKVCVVDRWGGLRRNLLPCSCLNHLFGAFFSRVPFGQPSYLPGSESVFGLSQGPPPSVFSS